MRRRAQLEAKSGDSMFVRRPMVLTNARLSKSFPLVGGDVVGIAIGRLCTDGD